MATICRARFQNSNNETIVPYYSEWYSLHKGQTPYNERAIALISLIAVRTYTLSIIVDAKKKNWAKLFLNSVVTMMRIRKAATTIKAFPAVCSSAINRQAAASAAAIEIVVMTSSLRLLLFFWLYSRPQYQNDQT